MSVHPSESIVIIGGGHAAAQLCASLQEAGLGPRVHLVCEEAGLPYQRPPLSKGFLKTADEAVQNLRDPAWFATAGITLRLGDAALSLDRSARTVTLRSGTVLPYGQLVLATGTRARALASLPSGLSNVLTLRDAQDARALRAQLDPARALTVLGGGFIGLEVAATARALGLSVQVLEGAPRLLGRSVSATLAAQVLATHQAAGIDIRLNARVDRAEAADGLLKTWHVDGAAAPVDLLLLGIGAVPETSLAAAAGLALDNGIAVDALMRTSDPHILAIGDCASVQLQDGQPRQRLESIQNANDQARTAAATLQGRSEPYAALPWFWSEQGSLRLQMAGLLPAADTPGLTEVRRPGATLSSFSLFHFVGAELRCVESVNAPMDHLMSRKLLEKARATAQHPTPAQVSDPACALKSLV